MAEMASSYIQAHVRLSKWNDELEFLGFILAELTDPPGLEAHRFPWHQAADLPALVDILEHQCTQPDGILEGLLLAKQRKRLRNWLLKSKQIRNAVAHHQRPSRAEMRAMHTVRYELGNLLETTIRTVAASRGVREVCITNKRYRTEDAEQSRLGGVLIPQPRVYGMKTCHILQRALFFPAEVHRYYLSGRGYWTLLTILRRRLTLSTSTSTSTEQRPKTAKSTP